jgi:hypothetical protein
MRTKLLAGIAAFTLALVYPPIPSIAATVYTYTGNAFTALTIEDSTGIPGSYDSTMRVTGSFTLNTALTGGLALQDISGSVIGFSFNDGRNTLSDSNAHIFSFDVATDATGTPTQWRIDLVSPFPEAVGLNDTIQTFFFPPGGTKQVNDFAAILDCTQAGMGKCITSDALDDAFAHDDPGTWTVTTVTPLPAALPLFATGLGALGLLGWRRKRKQAVA